MNLERNGVAVDFIPHTDGVIHLKDIEAAITPHTRLLTISWVQFLSGFRADLKTIGELCKAHDVIFCVDAIQGLGALQMDVNDCGIDFLACGGHKWLMANTGIGFIYVADRLLDQIAPQAGWLHGPVDPDHFFDYKLTFFPDASRFRLGTLNLVGVAALHAALGLYFEVGPDGCQRQVVSLAETLAAGLEGLGFDRYGSFDPTESSGIITVKHPDADGVYRYLKARSIVVSVRNRLLSFAPTFITPTMSFK